MTKQRTANVKMSPTVGVVWLVNPILIILHCQIRRGASAGSTWQLQEYTTKLSENILKLRSIFCENVSPPVRK